MPFQGYLLSDKIRRLKALIRELEHQTFLRSRTSTESHWNDYVRTAHVITFASSRRRRQNGTFQVEGRTPQKYAVILSSSFRCLKQRFRSA